MHPLSDVVGPGEGLGCTAVVANATKHESSAAWGMPSRRTGRDAPSRRTGGDATRTHTGDANFATGGFITNHQTVFLSK